MNGPFVVAQADTKSSGSNAAPVQIIKVIKPPAGHTEIFHASFDGTVKVDFTAIANEKITLYHDQTDQTLHIIFTDGAQAIIEPFFDSMGVLSNILVEVAPNQDLNGAQFAAQFPITEDQSVLPAAGPGAPGTPASGADFQDVSVTPLETPPPLPLLPPEELPPITFTNIEGQALPTSLNTTITVGPGLPLVVDESFIPVIGSQQLPSGSSIAVVDESGAFAVSGGGGTTTYSLTINNATTGLIDSKTGTAVTLVQVDGTHINAVDGAGSHDVVFTLSVDSSTGVVTMTDLRGVHEGSPDIGTDSNESITLASGLVSLTATNGAVSADLDLGSLITVHDDGPVVTASASGEPSLTVDESFIPVIGSQQLPSGSSIATGDFHNQFTVTPGADGQSGTTSYSLTINNATTGLTDSLTGTAVKLVQVSATEVDGIDQNGAASGVAVFTLTVDSGGVVTMTDLRGVHEDALTTTPNDSIQLASGLVSLTATVTDNDGDQASASLDLGPQITIFDDGPTVSTSTSGEPSLTVDESFIPVIGSQQLPSGSSIATGDFHNQFTVTPGADGQSGTTSYSLTINNATTGLTDSLTGTAVKLVQVSATEVDGIDQNGAASGVAVFTLTVDSGGVVTMTDLRGVHEDALTTTPNDSIQLASGLVSLTATVTDNDGDQASASLDLGPQITIFDDGPTVSTSTSGEPSLTVDESFIPVIGSQQLPSGSSIATGDFHNQFTVTPGADGQSGTTSYSLTINNATTGLTDSLTGTAVKLVQVSATEVDGIDQNGAASGVAVFTLTVDSGGVVTMTDLRGVHEDALTTTPNDSIQLASGLVSLTATVTDNDGDQASASLDLGPQITIFDDGPTVSTSTSGEPSLTVDESFIPVIGSQQLPSGSSIATGDFHNQFTVTPGADGQSGTTSYSLTINNATTGLTDSLTGTAVKLVQVSATEVDGIDQNGAASGVAVFTLTVDSGGVVTMTDLRGVHEDALTTTPNDSIQLASGLVSLTATVTDNDGDQASASLDLGPQITIFDDGPTVSTSTSGEPSLTVDESFIPVIGSQQLPSGSSIATGDFHNQFTVTPGADGQSGTTSYSLTINNATTGLTDSLTGTAVKLVQVSATEVDGIDQNGAASGVAVFTLTVDSGGVVTMTDLRGVHEDALTTTPNDSIQLASGLVSLTATVTDNDGDQASASLDLGPQITIFDDGPTVSTSTSGEPSLTVDESFIPVIGSQQLPSGSSIATGDFHNQFTVTPGADGQSGTTSYSLTINNATTGLTDSLTGTAVKLVQVSATEVDGIDQNGAASGVAVFTLTVDSGGVVTMTDLRGVHEDALTTTPNDSIQLASGLVSLTATVTDNDGDQASASLDLGPQITIFDDGPTVSTSTSGEPSLTVDESFIPVIGSQQLPSGSSIATGDFHNQFTVTPGADGQSGTTSYSLTINNATTGLTDSLTGTAVKLVQVSATEVDGIDQNGAASGVAVFTLTVDSGGVVTMTDLRGVHEDALTTTPNDSIQLASGLVSLTATVTDNDGDQASASLDLGPQITIFDDGPTVSTSTSGEPSLTVDESFIPVIGSQQLPSGSSIATGDFHNQFTVTPGADGQSGTTSYSLTINNATTGLTDSLTGTAVKLVQVSATEVDGIDQNGAASGVAVFTLTVDSGGVVTMTDLRGVHEDALTTTPNDSIQLASGLVSLTATVTDNDGDQASASLDLGPQITIFDDGPTVSTSTSGEPSLTVDESFIPVIGSQQLPSGSSIATGDFHNQFTVTPGADGQSGTTSYSLTINNATTGLTDSLTGTAVKLVQVSATEVDGIDQNGAASGVAVFTLTVDSGGVVTMTDLRGVHEDALTTTPNDSIQLASGLVSLTATVTDNDGDQASASLDLGPQITIFDDGPVISSIDTGIISDAAGLSLTGNINVTFGADGAGSPGLSFGSNPNPGITFDGTHDILYQTVGNTLTAYADMNSDGTVDSGDTQVFTLALDPNTDTYTFDLLQPFIELETLPVGSSSAFGAGPAGEQILLSGTDQLALISGTNTDGTAGDVNGSTVGWGVKNNNFDVNQKMLFDFTPGAIATPTHDASFNPVPNEEIANYTFSGYKSGDNINYVVTYWDGTTIQGTLTGHFDPSSYTTVATEWSTPTLPAGDILYSVSFDDTIGSGKVDLQSVSALTSVNLNENLTFNVTATDGDGDTTSGIINIDINGSTTLTGTSGNDIIVADNNNDTLVGLGGADQLYGGSGNDTFQYTAISDSTFAAHDSIFNFHSGDVIDFSAITSITATQGLIAGGSSSVTAHSVAWYNDGSGDTIVVANTTGAAEVATSAQMMTLLTGVNASTVTSGEIHHA